MRVALAGALILSSTGFTLAAPVAAFAAPVLAVSKSVSAPLLGGRATVSVTVKNNGDAKGYNLSLTDVMSSNKPNPQGRVTIFSADVPATTASLNAVTGDTTAVFNDLVDLAPTESHTFTFVVDLSGDPSWEVGDLFVDNVTAQVNTIPDNSGSWITGSASAQAAVTPIALVTKTANQSTGVHQATGTSTRQYGYTIKVQNNYTNPSASVVVTDTIPDGVEFIAQTGGPALDPGYPQRDPVTGITLLRWSLGTMAPGAAVTIDYATGIRYDYFGTTHFGTNRAADDFSSPSTIATAAIIPNKTVFTNTAVLQSQYKGSLPATITPTASASASVTGAYVTIAKSADKSAVGYDTLVRFTLSRTTSEYYTSTEATMTDVLPDGLTYVGGSASLTPDSVTHDAATGQTTLVWYPATMGSLGQTARQTITLEATVDRTWEQTAYAAQPIRAGDGMTNTATMAGAWADQVKAPRTGTDTIVANVSASLNTRLPSIYKQIWDPTSGVWTSSAATATVGDTLTYRVRFNTLDGATPENTDISMGSIRVTDWLPPGTVYNAGSAVTTYSAASDFAAVGAQVTNIVTPNAVTIGSLSGRDWFLGDVAEDGWWQTTFTVTVVNDAVVTNGLKTGNHWKLTGINTFGQEYSDRAIVPLEYGTPLLTLTKDTTGTPVPPLVPGSVVPYDISIVNSGLSAAQDVSVVDTLPVGMRAATPTIVSVTVGGNPLVLGTDYKTTYNPGTGVFVVDLHDASAPAVDTAVPAGSTLRITYTSTVDTGVGAGATLTDLASVGYNTQADGTGRATPITSVVADPNTDDAVVSLTPLTIAKTAPAGPYTIGDSWTDTITVTVPAGMVAYWPQIVDRIARDGVYVVAGTSAISTVSGTPPTPAALVAAEPVRSQLTADARTDLTWNLANYIDNTGQATPYVFQLTFTVRYTGVGDTSNVELFAPTATDVVTNTNARVLWNTVNVGARATNMTATSGAASTNVDQPLLRTVKSVTNTGPYAGDSTVAYRAVITNTGWARAYDLTWDDVLPNYLGTPVLVSVTKDAADILGSVTANFSSTPTLTIDFGSVSLGTTETITIDYTVKVDPNVPASVVLTNRVDTDWSSLPGTVAGERIYNDASWESGYVLDTSQINVTVASPTIAKSIVSGDPARIGDTVRYRLRVTVPAETVLPGGYVMDTVAADGFTYVNGSAAATLVSGSPEVAAVVSTTTFSDVPNPGSTLRFDFASMVDNSSAAPTTGDAAYVFDITYDMLYDGITDAGGKTFFLPGAGNTVSNTARLWWTVNGSATSAASAAVLANIDQPLLALDKTETSSGPYQGGTTVTYRTVITNTGWARAYDLAWQDVLDPYLQSPTLVSVTKGATDILGSVTPDFSSTPTVTIDFGAVSLGTTESITVVYTAVVVPSVGSGSVLHNTADVDWSSLPGTPAGGRRYDDSAWEAAYTADTDTQAVTVASAALTKMVAGGFDTTPTIGDVYDYMISFQVPAETTLYNTTLSDLVPDGLTVLSTTPSPVVGSVVVSPQVAGATPVLWTLGTVVNPDPNAMTLSLDVQVRVDKTYNGGASVLKGNVIANGSTLAWSDASSGGTAHSASSTATVTVVEPTLTIAKARSAATVAPGQDVTYTVTVTNTGTSPAYDSVWQDTLPAGLTGATLISVTPAIAYAPDFSGSPQRIDFTDPIPVGGVVTIVYKATLLGGIASGVSEVNTATIAYTSLPGVDANERAYGPVSSAATVVTLAPVLAIAKSVVGDTRLQVGQPAHYRIVVSNTGNATAFAVVATDTPTLGMTYVAGTTSATWSGDGISIADPAPAGSSNVWDFGGAATIAAGQTLTIDYDMLVGVAAVMGTTPNTVVASGVDGGGAPRGPVTANASVLLTNPLVSIDKHLAPAQDAHVQVGQTVTYEIVIHNAGTSIVSTLPLTDTFEASYLTFVSASPSQSTTSAGSIHWSDVTGAGSLAVGADTTVTATFRVTAQPPALSSDDTAAVVGAIDQYGDSVPGVSDTATVGITTPNVALAKALSDGAPSILRIGDTTHFDITVTNNGNTALAPVPLADAYDAARLEFVGATIAPTVAAAGSLGWNDVTGAGTLAPGASIVVTVELRALTSVALTTNTASIAASTTLDAYGDTTGGRTASASVAVVQPTLTLAKAASAGTVYPGRTATYTVTITNTGNGPAYDVAWTDLVPVGLSAPALVSVELNGSPMDGAAYLANFATAPFVSVGITGPIAAGDVVTITYTTVLDGGIAAGTPLTNAARIGQYSTLPGVDPTEATYGPVDADATVVTRAPALAIVKSVIGDTELQVDEEAHYRIVVSNTGDAPAFSVTVTDTPAAGLTFVAGSTDASWSGGNTSADDAVAAAGSYVWDFGGAAYIDPGESLTLDYRMLVGDTTPMGDAPNTAVAGAVDGGGAGLAPATDGAQVLITTPGLSLSKHLAPTQDPQIQVGETVTFEYVVHNGGTTAIMVLPLNEVYDTTYLEFVEASPAQDTAGPGVLGWSDLTGEGMLAVGANTTVTVTFRAIAHPATSSTTDTATISGVIDQYEDPAPDATSSAAIAITAPSVSVTKSLSEGTPAVLRIGELTSFDLVVRNTGDTTLTTVPLADTYDAAHLAYVSGSPTPPDVAAGSLGWTDVTGAGSLAPGASTTVTVEFRATETTALTTNLATIAAESVVDINLDTTAGSSDDATVTVVEPSLTLSKTASAGTIDPGEGVTYTVEFSNTGNGPAYDVAFSDRIPDQLYAAGTSPTLVGILRNGSPMLPGLEYTADLASSPTATILFPGPIAAGDTVEITYVARLAGGVAAGVSLTNAASISEYSSMPGEATGERTYAPLTDATTVVTHAPAISLTKTIVGDTEVQAGEDVSYLVTVVNTGDAPAYAVVVTDTPAPGLSYVAGSTSASWSDGGASSADPAAGTTLTWDFGDAAVIAPGETLSLRYHLLVAVAAPLGDAANIAGAAMVDGGGSPRPPASDDAAVLVTEPKVSITKAPVAGQDLFVQVGDTASFDIVVTNTGSTAITTLPLRDVYDPAYLSVTTSTPAADLMPAGTLDWTDLTGGGSLAAGASATVTVTYHVDAMPASGVASDTASVVGAIDQYGDGVPNVDAEACVHVTRPEVTVTKHLSEGQRVPVALGRTVGYVVTVANTGDTTLTTVPFTDSFDSGALAFDAATPSPDTTGTGTLGWTDLCETFGPIAPGAHVTLQMEFTIIGAAAAAPNAASVAPGAGVDVNNDTPAGSTSTATVDTYDPAAITITKTADPVAGSRVRPGDLITYHLRFENRTSVTFPSVSVTDTLPPAVLYVPSTMVLERGSVVTSLTDDATDVDGADYDPTTGAITVALGGLAPDATGTVSFTVRVRALEFSQQGVRNVAALLADDDVLQVTEPVDHPVDPLGLGKTAEDVNGGRLAPGDEILWTIRVSNTGLIPMTNTVVRDMVPDHTTYVRGSIAGRGADASGAPRLIWNVGTMEVGEVVELTFRSRVEAGIPANTTIRNQATGSSDQSGIKYSDSPETTDQGDATLLRTGGDERPWMLLALAAMVLGGVALVRSRRRPRLARHVSRD